MTYRIMEEADIRRVIPMYIEYYNCREGDQWTEETTYKRIHQVWSREDSYCLLLENEGNILGFAMGYFEQYDDGFTYDLVEIVIVSECQNHGLGTSFMKELERRVREKGALLIQLQAVNDAFHEHFYSKLGYGTVTNLVCKSKMLNTEQVTI